MSNDLQAKFDEAKKNVVSLAERPNNSVLLKLYSLYKQATEGDVKGEAPSKFDLVASKKYEAWQSLLGKSKEEAMQGYIDEVNLLLQEE